MSSDGPLTGHKRPRPPPKPLEPAAPPTAGAHLLYGAVKLASWRPSIAAKAAAAGFQFTCVKMPRTGSAAKNEGGGLFSKTRYRVAFCHDQLVEARCDGDRTAATKSLLLAIACVELSTVGSWTQLRMGPVIAPVDREPRADDQLFIIIIIIIICGTLRTSR